MVGNSGVLFEAIQANKNIIRFKFDDRPIDIYPLPSKFPSILQNLDELDKLIASSEKISLKLNPKLKNYVFEGCNDATFESSRKLAFEALQKIYSLYGF